MLVEYLPRSKTNPESASSPLAEESVKAAVRLVHLVNFDFGRERLNHSSHPNSNEQLPSPICFGANNAAAVGSFATKQNNEVDADDSTTQFSPRWGR